MKVLKATVDKYGQLNGYQQKCSRIEFVLDGNGNYIVGKEVLTDPTFKDIHKFLELLEEIEYVPIIGEEIDSEAKPVK